jgi:hypothetical protein
MEAIGGQNGGIQFFFSRCNRLREELRWGMPSTTEIVGSGEGDLKETFVIAFCPRNGHGWRFDTAGQLEEELLRRNVKGSVVKLDARRPWLRVALPFYGDAREITRTAKFLKEVTI